MTKVIPWYEQIDNTPYFGPTIWRRRYNPREDIIDEIIKTSKNMLTENNQIKYSIVTLDTGYSIRVACPGFDSAHLSISMNNDKDLQISSTQPSLLGDTLKFELTLEKDSDIISIDYIDGVLYIITNYKNKETPGTYKVGYKKKEQDVIVSES